MYYLGIDWANEKHDVCLLDAEGNILRSFTLTHDLPGFRRIEDLVLKYPDIRLNIERSDGLLVDWILDQGWELYLTPPYVISHRRPRRAKSDPGDAYLLAHLLRMGDPECRRITRSSPLVLHLRELVRCYDSIMADQRRLGNRLRYVLLQYFPNATRMFAHVESLICLAMLEAFPTPEAAWQLSFPQFQRFLKQQHYPFPARAELLYAQLHQPMPHAAAPAGYVAQVLGLIPLLRALHHQKAELKRQIEQVFRQHPEAAWWRSFPGAGGQLTGARLLAWIGDNRERFPTAQSLQATAGTAPVTRRSGKSMRVEFRRACSHPLRSAADDLARQSVKHSAWARAYYDQQRSRGHAKPRAFRALANRWMKVVWTLWLRKETYDEARHLADCKPIQPAALKRAG